MEIYNRFIGFYIQMLVNLQLKAHLHTDDFSAEIEQNVGWEKCH